MTLIYTRCDSVFLRIPEGTVGARLCRVLLDEYLSESLILRFYVFCDSIQVSKAIYWMIKLFTGFGAHLVVTWRELWHFHRKRPHFPRWPVVWLHLSRESLCLIECGDEWDGRRVLAWVYWVQGGPLRALLMIYCRTGVKTLLAVVVTPFATGRGLPCRKHWSLKIVYIYIYMGWGTWMSRCR